MHTCVSSKLEPSALFASTVFFGAACLAVSILALSNVWRRESTVAATSSNLGESDRERPAQRGLKQQCAANQLSSGLRDRPSDSTSHEIAQQWYTELTELMVLCARTVRLLRTGHDEQAVALELVTELSHLTTTLCRLQQALKKHSSQLGDDAGFLACSEINITSIQATLMSLEASIRSNAWSPIAISDASKHVRDQKATMDFLLDSIMSASVATTPPAESTREASLEEVETASSYLLSTVSIDKHAGGRTAVDEPCWIEPPPEYSPAGARSPVLSSPPKDKVETPTAAADSPQRKRAHLQSDELYSAVNNNDSEALTGLLVNGADPAARFGDLKRTALQQAALLNYCSCLAVLLRHGSVMAIEDAKGDTALHLAAWAGNVEALGVLLAHGADVDWLSGRDGYSPLWCAISGYQIDAVRLLLKHGARVSLRAVSGGGLTPLHQAAVTGQSAVVEILLQRGAQADCRDDDLNTSLHYAAACGSCASVELLVNSGADIDARQIHGLTPAHWAAHKGHAEVLEVLLNLGARSDSCATDGATPLHLAANRGHVAAARLLLRRGTGKSLSKSANWDAVIGTPADMAKAKGHKQLAKLLEA